MADDTETTEAVDLLQRLQMSDPSDVSLNLDAILSFLYKFEGEDLDCHAYGFVECGILTTLYDTLTSKSEETELSVVKILAELAKAESVRQPCVDKGFIPVLLNVLKATEDDVAMATQVCRALGNICYENDGGRNVIDKEDGIPVLISLMKNQLKNNDMGADKLRMTACGFLLNLTNTNDSLLDKAADDGAMEVLEQYVKQHRQERDVCNMALLALGSFLDSEKCQEKLQHSDLCKTIVKLLDTEEGVHYEQLILEIFITLAEIDCMKDILAETSLSNHLIKIIQSNTGKIDEESQQIVKMASDLLVLLLTGDKSMEKMFDNGKGEVFLETFKWLDSDSAHLKLSAALAIGNFARSDEHCQKLVEQGIVEKLVTIIQNQNPTEGDITLQHAVLSALRNLAIPASNKTRLLEGRVINAALHLLPTTVMAVVFKLLGVLRMLIDGQEEAAIELGSNREFLVKVIEWCDVEEHAGVQGEATRLLASLVKNSSSTEVMKSIVRLDGVEHLVSMVSSEHVVMQNEALIALTLIGSTVLADAALPLKESDLTETITNLLRKDKLIPELLCNTLTLTHTICSAGSLKEDLVTSGIADLTKELTKHEDEKVRGVASSLLTTLEGMNLER